MKLHNKYSLYMNMTWEFMRLILQHSYHLKYVKNILLIFTTFTLSKTMSFSLPLAHTLYNIYLVTVDSLGLLNVWLFLSNMGFFPKLEKT